MSSAKWRPFHLGLSVLAKASRFYYCNNACKNINIDIDTVYRYPVDIPCKSDEQTPSESNALDISYVLHIHIA